MGHAGIARRVGVGLIALGSVVLVTACGTSGQSEDAGPDADAVKSTLTTLVDGMSGRDPARVCSLLYKSAQDAIIARTKTENCWVAVESGDFPDDSLAAARAVDTCDVEFSDQVATVTGDCADSLSELLGTDNVWLSWFEDGWMVQGTAELEDL